MHCRGLLQKHRILAGSLTQRRPAASAFKDSRQGWTGGIAVVSVRASFKGQGAGQGMGSAGRANCNGLGRAGQGRAGHPT